MTSNFRILAERWNWRLSAHFRLASLGSVWVIVLGSAVLGPLLPILGIARMASAGGQLLLNHKLARRLPLERRDHFDWVLLALAFAAAILAASVGNATGGSEPRLMLLPVLIPYSVLQLRSFRRSLAADRLDRGQKVIMLIPLVSPGQAQHRAA